MLRCHTALEQGGDMYALHQSHNYWRSLIIVLTTATMATVTGVSAATAQIKSGRLAGYDASAQTGVGFFNPESVQLASIGTIDTSLDNSAPSARHVERAGEPFNRYTFRA